ncbi:MAG TPA: type II secretion system minor pseudopilin GspJ, partial [Allosphingosinicella sp.]|nr:type II secretion system minor pseudopilin GspJ [Allosphingosinicella sp.]
MKRNGFTLVEMLIALSIFGMLTAAGVALLTVTARTQESSDRLLAEVGELRRVGALLGADLAQAAPRIYRDEGGRPRRAFAGSGGEAPLLMAFVRRGWDSGDGPALQRVEYRLRAGAIERVSYAHVDGASEPLAVVPLIDRVRTLRLRYRDSDGAWRER